MANLRLENLAIYKNTDVPEQIRRRMHIAARQSTLGDMKDTIAQEGITAFENADFKQLLAGVSTFDGRESGFENPFVPVGTDPLDRSRSFNARSNIYIFVAIVTLNPLNETRTVEDQAVVIGYTSEAEPSAFSNTLPDDTLFYIDEMYGLRLSKSFTAFGQAQSNSESITMVSNDVIAKALGSVANADELLITPFSISTQASMISTILNEASNGNDMLGIDGFSKEAINSDGITFTDSMTTPSLTPNRGKLINNDKTSPEEFISTLGQASMVGYMRSQDVVDDLDSISGFGVTADSATKNHLTTTRIEQQITNNSFIRALRDSALSKRAEVDIASNSAFRLGDLRNAISNGDYMDLCMSQHIQQTQLEMHNYAGSDQWGGRNSIGELVAYNLASRISPIMVRGLLKACTFVFSTTNRVGEQLGRPVMAVNDQSGRPVIETFTPNGEIPRQLAQRFMVELTAAIRTATNDYRYGVEQAKVYADLSGSIRVEIATEQSGGMVEGFTYATFMNSRINTTVTTDNSYCARLATSVSGLTSHMQEAIDNFNVGSATHSLLDTTPTNPFGNGGSNGGNSNSGSNGYSLL